MTVVGLGLDLVAVPRVERMIERFGERALSRLLTPDERSYCQTRAVPAIHIAARVAAKEAAFKALARDAASTAIGWREIEVTRDDRGRPGLRLHGRALEVAVSLGVRQALVSLTHVETHGAAAVVLLGET